MATLPQLVDQPPTWEPVPGGVDPSKVYATLKSEVARPPEYQTDGSRWDYRKVTITLYGRYDLVTTALKSVLAVFNVQTKLGKATSLTSGLVVYQFPSGAYFLRWLPLDAGAEKPSEAQKQGQQTFQATVTGEVWSERSS